jgi:hypothetical protein
MDFGDFRLISPDGSNTLPSDLWAALHSAMAFEPVPELLASWLGELERALGVTDDHRRAVIRADQEARGLRAPAEGRSELPDRERGRGEDDLRRLDRLNARLSRKDLSEKQRQAAIDERTALERAPAERADAAWREAVIGETTALEAARGHAVQRLKSGAVRVDSCPVLRLLRIGKLTAEQFDTAMEVRDLYDARSEGVGSQLGAVNSAGGAHNNDAYVFGKLQRAKALQRLGTIERRIALECRDEPTALQMLREVVGARKSLSAFGEGRAFERNAKALARALDAAKG